MSTVYEVAVKGVQQGKPINNIFHVWDGDDNAILPVLAQTFLTYWVNAFAPNWVSVLTITNIVVKSLSGTNPGFYDLVANVVGGFVGEALPTGVHVFAKLLSGDPSFRAGGKLIGGWSEAQFVEGIPTVAVLDDVQAKMDILKSKINVDAGCDLAIYRPTLSLPGLPQISIVSAILVRGGSTNNRRKRPFAR